MYITSPKLYGISKTFFCLKDLTQAYPQSENLTPPDPPRGVKIRISPPGVPQIVPINGLTSMLEIQQKGWPSATPGRAGAVPGPTGPGGPWPPLLLDF